MYIMIHRPATAVPKEKHRRPDALNIKPCHLRLCGYYGKAEAEAVQVLAAATY
jgi:hypothetical protein